MRANLGKFKALKVSALATISVVAVEVVLGLLVGSLAILSDGAHALLDAVATLVLLAAAKVSMKPPDEEHTYGHEKLEPLGGFVGGLILLGAAGLLAVEAASRLARGGVCIAPGWEPLGFAAVAYALSIEALRVWVLRIAEGGATVKAGLYHALADLGSTLVALLGFGLATLGLHYFDPLASLALCAAVAYMSLRLAWASGMELIDAAPRGVVEEVRRRVASTEGVHKVKSLRVRRTGAKTFVEATIQVPDYLGFQGSHALASKIEEGLRRTLRVADVTIHVEPVERGVEELVEKVARGVEGVVEVHEVNVSYAHGGLHVTLHACVDPELSVQEAHELAVKIEEGLRREVEGVADVAVHVEPFEASRRRGTAVDEKELQRAVQEVVGSFGEGLSVKRVVTYVGRRRHINIDCSFSGQMSIEEAHKISSKIEEELRRRFTETVVTVHVEPGRGEDAP